LNEIKANIFALAANTIHVYIIIYILGVFAACRFREQRVFPPIDLLFMALGKYLLPRKSIAVISLRAGRNLLIMLTAQRNDLASERSLFASGST
jgi:hypothetical protein